LFRVQGQVPTSPQANLIQLRFRNQEGGHQSAKYGSAMVSLGFGRMFSSNSS
jgi:hypothetical protein